jgi:hypothetical protein
MQQGERQMQDHEAMMGGGVAGEGRRQAPVGSVMPNHVRRVVVVVAAGGGF